MKTNKIDLSKCKVGAKLQRRNGKIVTLNFSEVTPLDRWPHECGGVWCQNSGESNLEEDFDIVAILPSEKKKVKAVKPLEHSLKLMSKAKVRESIAQLQATIKTLQALLK